MTKLNDLQSLLLSHASQRASGSLLPLPSHYTADDERVGKTISSLLRRKLLEPREVAGPAAAWRCTDDSHTGLFVTPAGLAAIGVEPEDEAEDAVSVDAPSPAPSPRISKIAGVLALLTRPTGATMAEITAATDWLPHSSRAALTGLRKKGHVIERFSRDDATCYRIAEAR
ncbi:MULTISPECIES: DUF3489 domain-containing protein [unclassified Sphingomonas]|uniref:DUF3489 domain-containing protein n=1 Tax=unclassified Sphingomonas TaxID=196159 RepID=UPI00226A8B58|nr:MULTISPECIES: DUF3489 domain-containing protein [unclassified Sphingomonas]